MNTGTLTCGCGAEYAPTPSGIIRHQMIHGHKPSGR